MITSSFLGTFALVLCTAALTTVIFQRLKQPVILGYLLAGLLIGPHTPWLVADKATTETLAELGIVLLLFDIGLEFSVRRLLRVGSSVAITAIIDISLMAWLGLGAALLLGWTMHEALFTGAMTAISSTTIIAKSFEQRQVVRKLRELVFGVLIVEDLVAVLFLAALATLGTGASVEVGEMVTTAVRLGALLLLWVTVGLLAIPHLIRRIVKTMHPETTLITSLGLAFASALLAKALGYSEGLGAFIAGSLIAESGKGAKVAELVRPVRDVFAAVFFVAVGMLIDPGLVREHWGAVAVLTVVVILGKIGSVSLGAFLAGQGTKTAIQAGMSMAQIGEFSFIIVSMGLATGAVRAFLFPVAVAVSAITTLLTPWLMRASDHITAMLDRRLPSPLQTYAALYGNFTEELRIAPARKSERARVKRLIQWLGVDAALTAVAVIAAATSYPAISTALKTQVNLGSQASVIVLTLVTMAVITPFGLGIARTARELGMILGRAALPDGSEEDPAVTQGSALVITVQIAVVFLAGLPILAVTQPFLPPFRGALVLGAFLAVLSVAAWRSARVLEGQVRAGAEMLADAVRSTLPPEFGTMEMPIPKAHGEADQFGTVSRLLSGLGVPTRFRVEAVHHAAGKTVGELDLHHKTGVTLLGITRKGAGIASPTPAEMVLAGDTIVLVGSKEAIARATVVLKTGSGSS